MPRKKRIALIILNALGAGLLLAALVLWAQWWLARTLEAGQRTQYLALHSLPYPTIVPATPTPVPTATLVPTPTCTPTATPTPQPQPPVRVRIPKIAVNSAVSEIGVVAHGDPADPTFVWETLGRGVGHDRDSVNPGEAGNIILFGHNNTAGEVFRRLSELEAGDQVHVYTADQEFVYVVRQVDIVRAAGATEQDKSVHAFYMGPKSEETLTLISCWPYVTYTHRVYVVAKRLVVMSE
jgi:sortase A